MMPTPRRKKWSEAEERTLIEKYGEMVSDGTLAKMKTREKKFKPIALCVNSMHHVRDPLSYPWQWTWKDVSTKVQNMRHQYLLVKQKIKKPELLGGDPGAEEFEWDDGLSYWPNFLRYKEVFGDVPLAFSNGDLVIGSDGIDEKVCGGFDGSDRALEIAEFGDFEAAIGGDGGGGGSGVLGLGFEYGGEEAEENFNDSNRLKEDGEDGFVYEELEAHGLESRNKKKRTNGMEKKAFGFLTSQLGQLREMEMQFEHRELERELERSHQRCDRVRIEREKERDRKVEERQKDRVEREKSKEKLRGKRIVEWEAIEKESEERERKTRENWLIQEQDWEERMNQRRSEWRKRIDHMLSQHRVEMGQLQSRILHEQQTVVNQFLGMFSQWTGHPSGLPDHTGASNHYMSQMMQNLHHVNGMVHDNTRVEGDNHDDQFIVDG